VQVATPLVTVEHASEHEPQWLGSDVMSKQLVPHRARPVAQPLVQP
jgi:hypothetical protein